MPDEDERIGDIAAQLEQSEDGPGIDDSGADDGPEVDGTDAGDATVDSDSDPDTEADAGDAASDSSASPDGVREPGPETPPFPFEATEMHGFYVRDGTWDDLRTTKSAVSAACSTFGVPEFTGREFQDACLRVAADHGEEVAAALLEGRSVEFDDERLAEIVGMLREQRGEDD